MLGLIPARGGSKAIPGKNLAQVAGRSLLAWTVEAALGCGRLTRVVVSTDDERIADEARRLGAEVPFMRPDDLAADETPMLDVVLHACDEIACDVVVLLQPTSPLRTSRHVEETLALLVESGSDAVVSVVEVPHQFRTSSLMRVEDDRLVPLDRSAPLLRQRKDVVYARNGPAVLAVRVAAIEREGQLYVSDMRPYPMRREESVDVDESVDLAVAEVLLTAGSRRP